jgi:hypothetical protein
VIKGNLRFTDLNPESLPVWVARPYIDAEIEIPILSERQTFSFLVDTGADKTTLNVKDAITAIKKEGYRKLKKFCKELDTFGVGGKACYYNVDAKIIFMHEDGAIEGFNLELWIARPARKGSRKLENQLRIPSLLGRDILCQFRMVMDYSNHELSLSH